VNGRQWRHRWRIRRRRRRIEAIDYRQAGVVNVVGGVVVRIVDYATSDGDGGLQCRGDGGVLIMKLWG
jgi:hypothetical protein